MNTYTTSRHVERFGSRIYNVIDCLHREIKCHKFTDRFQSSLIGKRKSGLKSPIASKSESI